MEQQEHLFRGKKNDTGDWVFGDLIHIEKDFKKYCTILDWSCQPFQKQVIQKSIGKFTGFKVGEKRLFEHDIIENAGDIYVIEWNLHQGNWDCTNISNGDNIALCELANDTTVLQGNIHDNPELLK